METLVGAVCHFWFHFFLPPSALEEKKTFGCDWDGNQGPLLFISNGLRPKYPLGSIINFFVVVVKFSVTLDSRSNKSRLMQLPELGRKK